jgi:hypothetical protein
MYRKTPTPIQKIQTGAQVPAEVRLDERLEGEMQNQKNEKNIESPACSTPVGANDLVRTGAYFQYLMAQLRSPGLPTM